MTYVPPSKEELARRGLGSDGKPALKTKPKAESKPKLKPKAKE